MFQAWAISKRGPFVLDNK
ncbi:unnamed protein product [Thlaspi arvense]|uniref:Uncharacterized protein n=1 Tax=Thlaspi arvense TaxID=13288 RepID=A0AAU9SXV9_THLAR|nr:unnamed protein product [Thlaspi arvense]